MQHDLNDIIDIFDNLGFIGLRDYISYHGAQVYNSETLKKFICLLLDTLIKIDANYSACATMLLEDIIANEKK